MANPLTRAFLRRFRVNPIFWYFQVFMIWLPVTLCFGFPVTLLLHNSRFTCVLLPEALKYGKPLQVAHRDDNARAMLRKIRKSSNFHTELKLQYVYFHYWNLGVQSQKLNFANSSNFSMDLPNTILTKATGFLPEFSENGLLVYHLATFILNKLLTRKNGQNEGHFWRSQLELINVFFKWWPKWHTQKAAKNILPYRHQLLRGETLWILTLDDAFIGFPKQLCQMVQVAFRLDFVKRQSLIF